MANYHDIGTPNAESLMGFDVAKFRAVLSEAGVLKPTKWMFSTTVPSGLIGGSDGLFTMNAARNIQFWATSASIPGATMVTHETLRYGYGVAVKRPYSPAFGPIQIGFTADGLGSQWTFFKKWLNLVIHYDVSKGIDGNAHTVNGGVQRVYEVSYPDDYLVDCSVSAFVDSGEEILQIVLRDAFPIQLSDMRMDWADTGGSARFNVIFHYNDWYQIQKPIQNALGVNPGQSSAGIESPL